MPDQVAAWPTQARQAGTASYNTPVVDINQEGPMGYYSHHVFFCVNQRDDGRQCCSQCGAQQARDYVKKRCKELGVHGPGQIRINNAGCLDRCEEGPVCVIYPEGTWYTYIDEEDVDEIIESHLVEGKEVERLKI